MSKIINKKMVKNLSGSKSFYEAQPHTTVSVNEGLAFESTANGGVGSVLTSNGPNATPTYQTLPPHTSGIVQMYTYDQQGADEHIFSANVIYFEMWMCGGGGSASQSNQTPAATRYSGGAGGAAATGYYISSNVPYSISFYLGAGGQVPNPVDGEDSNSVFYDSPGGSFYGALSIEGGKGGGGGNVISGTAGDGGGGASGFTGSWNFVYPGDDGESGWMSSEANEGNLPGGNRGGASFFGPSTGSSGFAQLAKYGAGGGVRTGARRGGGGGFLMVKEYF